MKTAGLLIIIVSVVFSHTLKNQEKDFRDICLLIMDKFANHQDDCGCTKDPACQAAASEKSQSKKASLTAMCDCFAQQDKDSSACEMIEGVPKEYVQLILEMFKKLKEERLSHLLDVLRKYSTTDRETSLKNFRAVFLEADPEKNPDEYAFGQAFYSYT